MTYIEYLFFQMWLMLQAYVSPFDMFEPDEMPRTPYPSRVATPEIEDIEAGGIEGEDVLNEEWEYIR